MFSDFWGNEAVIEHITTAINEGRLSHAYIIQGDRGSGKRFFALRTAALLSGGRNNPLTKKILEEKSPDVSIIDVPEKKKFITVDTIRGIKYEAYIKPNELDVRVFIINHADSINTAGQNALLKLLEEPPPNVYFFLLCENPSSLLPTVRSRAQCIRMERFSEEKIIKYLEKEKKIPPNDLEKIARASGGSIGRALEALDAMGGKKKNEKGEKNEFICALERNNFPEIISAVMNMPSDRLEFEGALNDLKKALRDILAIKTGRNDMSYFPTPKDAEEKAGMLNIKQLIAITDCLADAGMDINANLNVQSVKLCLAKRIMRALHG